MRPISVAVTPLRLAIVLSHPTQYYSPWFRWLQAQQALTFRVFYLWDFGVRPARDPQFLTTFAWDVDLVSGYDHEFVPNVAADPGTYRFNGLRNPALGARLEAWQPDAVLQFGYAYRTHVGLVLWARRRGVPLIFRGDSHLLGGRRLSWGARQVLRLLYAQFAAVTYVGQANREYFEALGVPPHRLFFAPHAVDATRFVAAQPDTRAAAAALRRELGITAATRVVLFAGKLIPAKGTRALLQAFLELAPPDAALVFVGDGEEKPALLELARRAPAGAVHFLPFANQSEMPARYALADLFVLPSCGLYETWGLAVNEAMHLGLPCLVSDRVGCQRDLVIDQETGWVFRADDPVHLREKLKAALQADLLPFQRNVARKIAGYTYQRTTEGLLLAVAAAGRPSRSRDSRA